MPLPFGFVPSCLPTKAPRPPTGGAWLHEIKHDGFRVIARKTATASGFTAARAMTRLPVLADRRGAGPAALALLHHRRRGGVLR